jgi:RNA polymerase II subunit A small phosphatase-like protein
MPRTLFRRGPKPTQVDAHVTKNVVTQVSAAEEHQNASIDHTDVSPPMASPLLPPPLLRLANRKLMVVDLDETLVHASFTPVEKADFILNVDVKGRTLTCYVRIRPYAEHFLEQISQWYEVVAFTASLSNYAHPVLDRLDPNGTRIHHRLFREHCSVTGGRFVKDMSMLGRPLDQIVIVDNNPVSFALQPRNGIHCVSWFDDDTDTELRDMLPFLQRMADSPDVYELLDFVRSTVQRQQ